MAGKLKLRDTVFSYLRDNAGKKFTARQIAEWIFKTYPDECEEKRRRSTQNLDDDDAFIQQLRSEIGAHRIGMQKKYPQVKITADRPRKYYYSTQSDEDEVAQAEAGRDAVSACASSASEGRHSKHSEQELYEPLMQYLRTESVFSMRIDEKTSSRKRGTKGRNHWLHPDIVGMEYLGKDWKEEVRDCVHECFDKLTRLWSFEVKRKLECSKVREHFFQALSNSSWANFAYLVVEDIDDEEAEKELRLLSAAHGIGLIKLNFEDPSESEIRIPARERAAVDWAMVNRLAKENPDFRVYLDRIRTFYVLSKKKRVTEKELLKDWGLPEVDD
ncbi:MAG: HrgA protein [Rhodocyclaceae bacterium]|nr:HrgA protein [Rhodocyclaceae bacterium]